MQWIDGLSPAMERQLVALARRAVEQHPGNAACRVSLAEALRKSGQPGEALAALDAALTRFPGDLRLLQSQVRAARMTGDWPVALAALDKIAALRPGTDNAQLLRCDTLFRMKEDAAAVASLPPLGGIGSGSRLYLDSWMKQLRREGRSAEMLALCDAHLASPRTRTSAVYHKVQLLLALGRDGEAEALLDLDRLAEIQTLDGPPDYPSAEHFRDAVAADILRNPTLVPDPAAKATRAGLQTRTLRQPGAVAVDALLDAIRDRIVLYMARLEREGHAFAAAAPGRARLNAWSVVYRAAGRQLVHHHGGGWLSGVFYVRAPRPAGSASYGGSLLLGALTIMDGEAVRHRHAREIEPVPGRLVLFPSSTPHASLPPDDDNSRIVVAFDVVPEFSDADDGLD